MAYCIRCGQKCSFLKSWTFPDGTLCNDCLKELDVSTSQRDKYMSMSGTYEMLLAEQKLSNPEVESIEIGPRSGDDYQTPERMQVRSLQEILKGKPTLSFEQTVRVTKGGNSYSGISFGLGHGVRVGFGGRSSAKTKTKNKITSIPVDFYLTSKRILFRAKEEFYSIFFSDIKSIKWHLFSFEVITDDDELTFTKEKNIEKLYYLIQLVQPLLESSPAKEPSAPSNAGSNTDDPIFLLREYKKLLDEGIINQEEFEAKKTELLKL